MIVIIVIAEEGLAGTSKVMPSLSMTPTMELYPVVFRGYYFIVRVILKKDLGEVQPTKPSSGMTSTKIL